MLPPEKIAEKLNETKPSQHSTGLFRAPATSAAKPDAVRPPFCSKTDSDLSRGDLNGRIDHGFLKHFNRLGRLSVLSPSAAARIVRSRISKDQEELWVIALSASKKVLAIDMLFRGTVDSCIVHPRDIVRFICEHNASSYIVAHNHPSGELEPSDQDWSFTRRRVACGDMIEIPLLDHIVVTQRGHTSMASKKPEVFQKLKFSEKVWAENTSPAAEAY